MIVGVDHIANREAWNFDCPEGTWTGRLDQKAWGKSTNLVLFFTDAVTGERYWFSVWHRDRYRPRDGSHDFKGDAEPGDLFELTTKKTKAGHPDLATARKLAAAGRSPG